MAHAGGDDSPWVVVLGPVGIVADGRLVTVPRAQARGVLAWLALHPGKVVGYQSIVEAMWGGDAPEKARGQVHSAVSAIRGMLVRVGRAEALESNRFGYRLRHGSLPRVFDGLRSR